ncbi:MAG: carbohydrate-binding family 9-like protein [Armatimonadetes bacterium]|nr:carbohydrate-binding family 9-like protein [Armatimonadota bacterium]
MRSARAVVFFALMGVCLPLAAQIEHAGPPQKKLLEYGWDVPQPDFVAKHIREMEQRPFDGLLMRIRGLGQVFKPVRHTRDEFADQFDALKRIEWDRFTDNFLMMYAASKMDWFSDEDWEVVVSNVRLLASAARIGGCVGVCFDCEPYGDNPWHYPSQPHAGERSFAEFQAKVRERGARFMDAIEAEMDDPVVHTFFLTTLAGVRNAAAAATAAERDDVLHDYNYGLYPAFINGMLDAMDPGTLLTDGNEPSYYYHDSRQYLDVYHYIKQGALGIIAPENQRKYRGQVLAAQALYVDHLFDLRTRKYESHYMTPEERAQWFEHNAYWALKSSDRYVWLYSEKMSWWENRDIPPGLEQAVINARELIRTGGRCDIDADAIWRQARERRQAEIQGQLIRRSARMRSCAAPTIDGHRDDAAWQTATELEPFLATFSSTQQLQAATLAHLGWNNEGLYLAVRCQEPKMEALELVGGKRDDNVWLGDSVDLFLQRAEGGPFYHIIVNPRNIVWDAVHRGDDTDTSWDPPVVTAILMGEDFWNLELALPWSAMGWEPPRPGDTLRANICRQRRPVKELSSWSQVVNGFVEPGSFGTFNF